MLDDRKSNISWQLHRKENILTSNFTESELLSDSKPLVLIGVSTAEFLTRTYVVKQWRRPFSTKGNDEYHGWNSEASIAGMKVSQSMSPSISMKRCEIGLLSPKQILLHLSMSVG
ncbi:hypothetical protein Ccrd_019719 [Cynara cardunculus var. scolymus]|uniref:Uncharacterized protein n=1 Tax=Cynara cardunculus var. scolymus TaxID=59895 RepID=A0A103Y3R3_CYNCS|nr:hypothetical protein Ccrd_019719 [Cynara cardunculus var. scolymus]